MPTRLNELTYIKNPNSTKNNGLWILCFLYIIILIIFFQEPFIKLFPDTHIRYLDELFIGAILFSALIHSLILRVFTHVLLITLFAIIYMTIISYAGSPRGLSTIFEQSVIHWKFFIFAILFVYILKVDNNGQSFRYFFLLLFAVSLVGFLINWFFQERFLEWFDTNPMYRNDTLRIQGFQLKPNDLALHLSIIYLYVVLLAKHNYSDLVLLFGSAIFFSLIYMTGSRTALSIIPLTLIMYVLFKKKWAVLMAVSIITSIMIIYFNETLIEMIEMTEDNISELSNIESTKYIRGIMIYYGIYLMIDNFPIGTGAATFGTVESKGSPVYDDLGISGMIFFEDMIGVYDSNLASIMGEFGFIGILLFYISLLAIYHRAMRISSYSSNKRLYLRILLLFSILVSVVNPLFMYSYNGLLFAMAFFLVDVKNEKHQSRTIIAGMDKLPSRGYAG